MTSTPSSCTWPLLRRRSSESDLNRLYPPQPTWPALGFDSGEYIRKRNHPDPTVFADWALSVRLCEWDCSPTRRTISFDKEELGPAEGTPLSKAFCYNPKPSDHFADGYTWAETDNEVLVQYGIDPRTVLGRRVDRASKLNDGRTWAEVFADFDAKKWIASHRAAEVSGGKIRAYPAGSLHIPDEALGIEGFRDLACRESRLMDTILQVQRSNAFLLAEATMARELADVYTKAALQNEGAIEMLGQELSELRAEQVGLVIGSVESKRDDRQELRGSFKRQRSRSPMRLRRSMAIRGRGSLRHREAGV